MGKIFSLIFVFLLVFSMTACVQNRAKEPETAEGIETPPEDDAAGEDTIKAAFDFETKTVLLNSGYEMPIYGIGTYSLTGDTCVESVTAALNSGVRLIDTAYMYHNDVICCEL